MHSKKKCSGFSLVELMVVIVIVGILSIIALPSYQKYIVNSKFSEAYTNLDTVTKSEVTYFNENKELISLTSNPNYVTTSMRIESFSDWTMVGNPLAVGSNVFFSYSVAAGKIAGDGTELAVSTINGLSFYDLAEEAILGSNTPSGACNRDTSQTPSSLGITAQNGLDWMIIKAHGDFDGDNTDEKCSMVFRITKTNPSTNRGPESQGFVVINKGS